MIISVVGAQAALNSCGIHVLRFIVMMRRAGPSLASASSWKVRVRGSFLAFRIVFRSFSRFAPVSRPNVSGKFIIVSGSRSRTSPKSSREIIIRSADKEVPIHRQKATRAPALIPTYSFKELRRPCSERTSRAPTCATPFRPPPLSVMRYGGINICYGAGVSRRVLFA